MSNLLASVNNQMKAEDIDEVMKITGNAVKIAVSGMKARKSDVSGGFTSDALLNGPDILFDHLASVFRSSLIHGEMPVNILACAFLPLLKSSLKDPEDINSLYRAIAGSSLILKTFER